jgi:N-acetylglucosamine-6-sulfatase
LSPAAVASPAANLPFLDTLPATTPLQRTDAGSVAAHAAALAAVEAGKASNVVFFGDSITAGWDMPGFGQPSWDASLAPLGAADFGVGGDMTQHLLWRLLNGELGGRPRVAVVEIGTNDMGYRPQETAAGIAAVVKTIRAESPGTRVLLLGILPRSSPSDPVRGEIAQVNGLIAGLADGTIVRYVDLSSLFLLPDGTIPPELMSTPLLLHPTTAGYQLMSDALRAPIEALLSSLPQPATPAAPDIKALGADSINYGAVAVSGSGTSDTNPGTSMLNRRLDVLPGDVNVDGTVNSQDMVLIRNAIQNPGDPLMIGWFDVDGNGSVGSNDDIVAHKKLGSLSADELGSRG